MGRRSASDESLGGCQRPWRDGRLRALLARIQELRQRGLYRGDMLKPSHVMAFSGEFVELPRPWLDDRLKKLVAHIEKFRSMHLT
ncbi:hypothetical protein Pan44_28470 [Caulifigura coniformis]|uniref:Uncharacterized protein n=1 Tax=Caulifigura coniformis TaxID=2527983 RepID=A0A517SFB0_9PLAN|nr:hypothetical protein [Caulifigura coniformis]QDT54809.1 hypothetical protein Pan44_28470 [Caulifigura coniformis]